MFIKKLFVFLTILLLSSHMSYAKGSNLYLTTMFTMGNVNLGKERDPIDGSRFSHDPMLSPMVGAGIGYYINDDSRIDLLYENLDFTFRGEHNNFYETDDKIVAMGLKFVKRKTIGESLRVNYYYDFLKRESFRFFLGGGAGAARIKEKKSEMFVGHFIENGQVIPMPQVVNKVGSKKTVNFNYAFIIGTSIKINSETNLELIYSWKEYGKAKYQGQQSTSTFQGRYKGHHFSIGMRFDI